MAVKTICHASRGDSNLAVSREVMVGQVMGHPNLVRASPQSAGTHTQGPAALLLAWCLCLNSKRQVLTSAQATQSLQPGKSKVNSEWPAEAWK